jgi:hypothetical protein
MASELFNTLTGYSVGIPAVTVIDETGNVVSNFLSLTGNVTANKVYANSFFYSNGQPFNANPGGSNTQLQYNNNGVFAGISTVTYNGSNISLGDISTVKIDGGVNGYVLQTDGSGNLTWTAQTGGNAGNGNPGGANSQVQYNNDGLFGGDAGFTYNNVTNTLYSDNIDVAGNVSIDANITALGNAYLGNISTTGLASITTLVVGTTANLGNVGNVIIEGGSTGQYLTTDGSGSLSWVTVTAPAAGANTQVQFNDAGTMNGSSSFTFNKSTNTLTATNFVGNGYGFTNVNGSNVIGTVNQAGYAAIAAIAGTVSVSAQPNITSTGTLTGLTVNGVANFANVANVRILGGSSGYVLQTDGSGHLSWTAQSGGGGNGTPGGVTTQLQYNNAGSFGGIPNVTFSSGNLSLGNVSNVKMTGGTSGYILSTDGTGNLAWIASTGSPGGTNQMVQFNDAGSFGGDVGFTYDSTTNILSVPSIKSNTTANFTGATNVNLGNVANLHISGGLNGYVLQTDGSGNLSWTAGGGGGNGTPGGANTQVQFNSDGTFGGSAYLTYNDYTKVFQVGGNLIANSFQMGAGVYKWSTSLVYFATTASTTPAQVLYSIPVANLSGVEFEIIATEAAGPSRQSCKISSLYYNDTVQFTEYASLFVNGGVGNFEVDYNAGNIITPPALELKVTPNSSNPITYKMLITVFAG